MLQLFYLHVWRPPLFIVWSIVLPPHLLYDFQPMCSCSNCVDARMWNTSAYCCPFVLLLMAYSTSDRSSFVSVGPGTNAGTTATVALLRDGIELVVASVGDSRAMLCRKGKALKLTVDHTPERKDEKERWVTWGGCHTLRSSCHKWH